MINEQVEANQQPEPGVIVPSGTTNIEPHDTLSPGKAGAEILSADDKEAHARSMKDEELLTHLEGAFLNWRQNIPYLKVARERFSKPGQRLPIAGNPTWTEWVEKNLGVSIRTVQRLLAEPKTPPPAPTPKPKPFAFAGLNESEVGAMVTRAADIGPETASRLAYNAIVRPNFDGDLASVRAAVKDCLKGLAAQKQLEIVEELQQWLEGQVADLREELGNTATRLRRTWMDCDEEPSAPETTLVAAFEQQATTGVPACA